MQLAPSDSRSQHQKERLKKIKMGKAIQLMQIYFHLLYTVYKQYTYTVYIQYTE